MLRSLFIVFLTIFLLTGCVKEDCVTLTFASWGSISEVQIIKNLINNFEKENSGVKVNFLHFPQNYFQKLHLLFASNTAPDVVFINNLYLPLYSSKLLNLSNEVNQNDFYEQAIDGMSYENSLYAIPRDISNLVFYVNLDLIQKSELELPDKNWRLEEVINISKQIRNDCVYTLSREDDLYWTMPYLRYFGGDLLSSVGQILINSEKSQKALSFYNNLSDKYKIVPNKSQIGSSTLAQMFLEGKIVFYLSGRWMYPKIKEKANFKWTIINFPNGESPQPCDVSGWAINKDSKNKELAIKFVEYLSSESSIKYFMDTGLIVPARISVAKNLEDNGHNERVFTDVISYSKKTNVNKSYRKLVDKYNKEIFK